MSEDPIFGDILHKLHKSKTSKVPPPKTSSEILPEDPIFGDILHKSKTSKVPPPQTTEEKLEKWLETKPVRPGFPLTPTERMEKGVTRTFNVLLAGRNILLHKLKGDTWWDSFKKGALDPVASGKMDPILMADVINKYVPAPEKPGIYAKLYPYLYTPPATIGEFLAFPGTWLKGGIKGVQVAKTIGGGIRKTGSELAESMAQGIKTAFEIPKGISEVEQAEKVVADFVNLEMDYKANPGAYYAFRRALDYLKKHGKGERIEMEEAMRWPPTEGETRVGTFLGSPGYMHPEEIKKAHPESLISRYKEYFPENEELYQKIRPSENQLNFFEMPQIENEVRQRSFLMKLEPGISEKELQAQQVKVLEEAEKRKALPEALAKLKAPIPQAAKLPQGQELRWAIEKLVGKSLMIEGKRVPIKDIPEPLLQRLWPSLQSAPGAEKFIPQKPPPTLLPYRTELEQRLGPSLRIEGKEVQVSNLSDSEILTQARKKGLHHIIEQEDPNLTRAINEQLAYMQKRVEEAIPGKRIWGEATFGGPPKVVAVQTSTFPSWWPSDIKGLTREEVKAIFTKATEGKSLTNRQIEIYERFREKAKDMVTKGYVDTELGPIPKAYEPSIKSEKPESISAPVVPTQKYLDFQETRKATERGYNPANLENPSKPPETLPHEAKLNEGIISESERAEWTKKELAGWTFIYQYGRPPGFTEALERRIVNIHNAVYDAFKIGESLKKGLTMEQEILAGRTLRGEAIPQEISQIHPTLMQSITNAKEKLLDLGKQAVDEGLMSEATFFRHAGKYMPRLYAPREYARLLKKYNVSQPIREDLERFKMRKDIPEKVRQEMGEIITPAYPVAKGIAQEASTIETRRLFNMVSRNSEWVSDTPKTGFDKMPESKRLGPLSGKYVNKFIASDINEIFYTPNMAEKIYTSLITGWKMGKTVYNPACHVRNTMSNIILNDLGGLSPLRVDIYRQALRELIRDGPVAQEARKEGLLGYEFVGGEIKKLLPSLEEAFLKSPDKGIMKFLYAIKRVGEKFHITDLPKLYQGEEQWFKLAKYIHNRKIGMPLREAIKDAEETIFNYSKVSPFIKFIRQAPMGSPFITFTSKALPFVIKSMFRHPLRFAKYPLLFMGIEELSRRRFGWTKEETQKVRGVLPEYMQQSRLGAKFLLLPFKDKYNRPLFWDLTYTLPWGDISEVGATNIPAVFTPGNPVVRIPMELLSNKSLYTGQDIVRSVDITPYEKGRRIADYIYKQLLPSLAPPLPGITKGGYGAEKLKQAILQSPDYRGRVRSLTAALSDTLLGLKTIPIDPQQSYISRVHEINKEIQSLKVGIRITQIDKSLSQEEKNREINQLTRAIQDLAGKYPKQPLSRIPPEPMEELQQGGTP